LATLPEAPPPATIVVVRERGWKARVVTKSPGSLVTGAHFARQVVYSSLKKDRHYRLVAEKGAAEAAVERLKGPFRGADLVVMSADLTAATDHLDFAVSRALWDGYCDGVGISETLRRVGHLALGPQAITLHPVTGGGVVGGEVATTNRGALMGLPLSWCMLSLANLYCAHASAGHDRRGDFVLCGDDLLAVWPADRVARYEALLPLTGMKFSSRAKHLHSSTYGLFAEVAFRFSPVSYRTVFTRRVRAGPLGPCEPEDPSRPRTWSAVVRSHQITLPSWRREVMVGPTPGLALTAGPVAIPLKGLVSRSCADQDEMVPWWVSIGPAATALATKFPERVRLIRRILLRSNPGLTAWARSQGFLPDVPRVFGGFGLPTEDRPLPRVVRAAATAIVFRSTDPAFEASKLARPFSLTRPTSWQEMAANDADEGCRSYKVVRLRYNPLDGTTSVPPKWDREGVVWEEYSLTDLWETLWLSRTADLTLMLGPEARANFQVKPGKVARAVHRRLRGYRVPERVWTRLRVSELLWRMREAESLLVVTAVPERGACIDPTYGGFQSKLDTRPLSQPAVARGLGWSQLVFERT